MSVAAHRLIDAFLAGDAASAAALLAPDATFRSPLRDYVGAERIAAVWEAVRDVVGEARPTSVHARDREVVTFFTGTIAGRCVEGVMRAIGDADGRVGDVTLMVRPWAALKAGLAGVAV